MLTIGHLSKTYANGTEALRAITLDVPAGTITAVIGGSGCGKTTLLRLIAGLDRASSGRIAIDGETIYAPHPAAGIVFQEPRLFPWLSVEDNVAFGIAYIAAGERRARVEAVLHRVGLIDYAKRLPRELSGGQQQRVAIARALSNQPSLLLADEPTGNLDTRTSVDIMGVFQKLNDQGMTIVMVTHELDIAQYTKRMVVMRDGKVVGDTPVPKRLIAENELRRLQEEQKAVQLAD